MKQFTDQESYNADPKNHMNTGISRNVENVYDKLKSQEICIDVITVCNLQYMKFMEYVQIEQEV